MIFAPLNVAAFRYIPPHLRGAAVGLLALLRNEGGSVGTSIGKTIERTARAVPRPAAGREPRPAEPRRAAFFEQGASLLPAADGRSGPVAADDPRSRCTTSASSRRRRWPTSTSSGVRRPGGAAGVPRAPDEALGGREGRTRRRGVTVPTWWQRPGQRWLGQVTSCTCRQCSYMRFTIANTNAVDQPTRMRPVRPSIPASNRQPGPRTTSPKPTVV